MTAVRDNNLKRPRITVVTFMINKDIEKKKMLIP